MSLIHDAPGIMILRLTGNNISDWYQEAGGHRIQRIPPTERKGRTHTSTVTVAVLPYNPNNTILLKENDLKIEWYSGSGAGGQFRNKHQNSIRLTHIPTGIVQTAQTRSRKNSYDLAYKQLSEIVNKMYQNQSHVSLSAQRKEQVGSGQRGDKIRTIQFQHNSAIDHRTGKRCTADQYIRGDMHLLWPSTK